MLRVTQGVCAMVYYLNLVVVAVLAAALGGFSALEFFSPAAAPSPTAKVFVISEPQPRPAAPMAEPTLRDAVAQKTPVSGAAVEARYNEGIDLYVAGNLEGARQAFDDVLGADPRNIEARNALRRVSRELE